MKYLSADAAGTGANSGPSDGAPAMSRSYADFVTLSPGNAISGVLEGISWNAEYRSGGRNQPATLFLDVPGRFPAQVLVTREGRVTRLAKAVGVAMEVQTGDQAFDEAFYLETDDAEGTSRLFREGAALDAVRDLMGPAGDGTVQVTPVELRLEANMARLVLRKVAPVAIEEARFAMFVRALGQVAKVGAGLTPTNGTGGRRPLAGRRTRTHVLGALVLAGIVHGGGALVDDDILLTPGLRPFALSYSVPVGVAMALGAFVLLRGRSDSHRRFAWALAAALAVALVAGPGLVSWLNCALDPGPATTVSTEVIGRSSRKHNGKTRWYLELRNPEGGPSLQQQVPGWDGLDRGDTVQLATRPGRFGFVWVERIYWP